MFSYRQFFGEDETSFGWQPFFFFTKVAIFFFFFFFIILQLMKWFFQPSGGKRSPPSPPKLPIIGNLHQIDRSHPYRSLWALAQHHGPLMLLHLGKVRVLVVSSADAAREIMRTHDIIFANRPKSTPFEKLSYGYRDVALAPYGEYWRQIKSICVLHLLNTQRVNSFRNVREEEILLMMDKIKQSSSSSSPVNLSDVLWRLTNDIVARVTLGRKYDEGSKLKRLFCKLVEMMAVFHMGDYIPWLGWVCHFNGVNADLDKVAKDLDDFIEGVLVEHENKNMMSTGRVRDEDLKDFVDVLLWVQKENVFGFPIDRVSIKALILDMFGAGTDTTYTVLEWVMTELLRHPKVMKQVQKEVRGIVGDKLNITYNDLDQMHYLKAVIKETLRVHPPIPLITPRESSEDVKINDYDISAGTQVYINYWAIARDHLLWEKAEEFWPDRFLNSCIDFKGQDFKFIPFGSGRRSCPGIQFAMRTDEIVLANLLNKFDWSLPNGARGEDLDVAESTGFATHRKFPLVVCATPCSP